MKTKTRKKREAFDEEVFGRSNGRVTLGNLHSGVVIHIVQPRFKDQPIKATACA